MLASEALLLQRRREEALEEGRREFLLFSSDHPHEPAQHVRGGRRRACAVVIQALFELGRGEEAEDFTLQGFCPDGSSKCFGQIPPVLVDVLYKLRRFLDDGRTERAGKLLQSFFDTYSREGMPQEQQEDREVLSRLAQNYLLEVVAKEQVCPLDQP